MTVAFLELLFAVVYISVMVIGMICAVRNTMDPPPEHKSMTTVFFEGFSETQDNLNNSGAGLITNLLVWGMWLFIYVTPILLFGYGMPVWLQHVATGVPVASDDWKQLTPLFRTLVVIGVPCSWYIFHRLGLYMIAGLLLLIATFFRYTWWLWALVAVYYVGKFLFRIITG